eukprot:scaffold1240_cov101-Isochrysis_galbana.AAC.5
MAAGAFARLGLRLHCLLLVPGARECPQAPQDDAGRETPERKGLGKSQVGSESQALCALRKFWVGWLTARAGRPGLDVPECHWMPERWVLGRASHRAAIGGRELVSGATHRWARATCEKTTQGFLSKLGK